MKATPLLSSSGHLYFLAYLHEECRLAVILFT